MATTFKNFDGVNKEGQPIKVTLASGPVIIDDGRVLLDKHGDDEFWKFPGGRLPDDRSIQETAIEQVKDELGIKVDLKGEPFIMAFDREKDGVKEYVVLIHYLAEWRGQIKPGRHIKEWKWLDVANLPEDCAPNIKPVVNHFLNKK